MADSSCGDIFVNLSLVGNHYGKFEDIHIAHCYSCVFNSMQKGNRGLPKVA